MWITPKNNAKCPAPLKKEKFGRLSPFTALVLFSNETKEKLVAHEILRNVENPFHNAIHLTKIGTTTKDDAKQARNLLQEVQQKIEAAVPKESIDSFGLPDVLPMSSNNTAAPPKEDLGPVDEEREGTHDPDGPTSGRASGNGGSNDGNGSGRQGPHFPVNRIKTTTSRCRIDSSDSSDSCYEVLFTPEGDTGSVFNNVLIGAFYATGRDSSCEGGTKEEQIKILAVEGEGIQGASGAGWKISTWAVGQTYRYLIAMKKLPNNVSVQFEAAPSRMNAGT